MSLILATRPPPGPGSPAGRSPATTLDRAHTAHALTLTGALVRRGAVGAEPRADRDGDGSRRSDPDAGCRTIRAEESQDVLGERLQGARLTQSGIAGGKRSVPLY